MGLISQVGATAGPLEKRWPWGQELNIRNPPNGRRPKMGQSARRRPKGLCLLSPQGGGERGLGIRGKQGGQPEEWEGADGFGDQLCMCVCENCRGAGETIGVRDGVGRGDDWALEGSEYNLPLSVSYSSPFIIWGHPYMPWSPPPVTRAPCYDLRLQFITRCSPLVPWLP